VDLEHAFLDDVIGRPGDDAPRLVYADWLDDHGDADRAEFVRVQCRLARMSDDDPGRPALVEREKELLDRYAVEWVQPLRGMVSEWGFSRGFIDYALLYREHDDAIDDHLPKLFRLTPLAELTLEDYFEDAAPALLRVSDQLPRLRYLDLCGLSQVQAKDLMTLLTSPALRNLRTLYLDQEYADELPVRALSVLGKSPALSRLAALGLLIGDEEGDLPSAVVRAIARSTHLRPERLYLANTHLATPLRAAELRLAPFQGLEALCLMDCAVGIGF
jgi:uncharacterized protein (TIGR02996 family)